MIDFPKNIAFQKQYFPDILTERSAYSGSDEPAAKQYTFTPKKYIYIYCTDPNSVRDVLNDLFFYDLLEESAEKITDMADAEVRYSLNDSADYDSEERVLKLNILHPFPEGAFSYYISPFITKNEIIEQSYYVFVYENGQKLKKIDQTKIKNLYGEEPFVTENIEELRKELHRVEPCHVIRRIEQQEISHSTVKKEIEGQVVSIKICDLMFNSLQKNYFDFEKEALEKIQAEFERMAAETTEPFLRKDSFCENLVYVQTSINETQALTKFLMDYMRENLKPLFERSAWQLVSGHDDDIFTEITCNENIQELDNILNKKKDNLYDKLEALMK